MKPRLRFIFVISLFLLGTVVGWQAKTWAVERQKRERLMAICDQSYNLTRTLIASYGGDTKSAQLFGSDGIVGQYNEEQNDKERFLILEDTWSAEDADKFHRQSLRGSVRSYGRTCSRAKQIQLQNELEQAFRHKDAGRHEEQTQ